MSATLKPDALRKPDAGKCLARSVAEALAEDPTLEAVTVDQARHTISVATLGKSDVPKLTERIRATVRHAQEAADLEPCTLLEGETTCQTCGQPLSEFERRKITIRQEADTTTIARLTCPTAPTFWRWRDIPWPKVVQRDVEFLEHAKEVNEWKGEMATAVLCGMLGLGAWYFSANPLSVIGYVLAYLAGGWFTAQDVWERQCQHWRLGRGHDVAVSLLAFGGAGEFCAGADATGDSFALSRSTQVRDGARRAGP
jgi:Cd2+/Zn2+-exporting ATPase